MNDFILIFIVAAYICVGVFVVVWMDNEYFDRKGEKNHRQVGGGRWPSGPSCCFSFIPRSVTALSTSATASARSICRPRCASSATSSATNPSTSIATPNL